MENTGTLHSLSERFTGHSDIIRALRSTVVKRKKKKANNLFVCNPAFPNLLALEALLLRSPY